MIIPHATEESKKKDVAVRSIIGSKGSLALASSTLFSGKSSEADFFGFVISYNVRIKLRVAQYPLQSAVVAHVPVFIVAGYKNSARHHVQQSKKFQPSTAAIDSSDSFRNRG